MKPVRRYPNLVAPTFGGLQLWEDVAWRAGWRVQRQAVLGHARLLDPAGLRQAWGKEPLMLALLAERTVGWKPSGPATLMLHGLGRGRRMFRYLRTGFMDGTVIELGYPSTLGPAARHAPGLCRLLATFEGFSRLDLVAYSMGGLVARAMFADPELARLPWGRAVMIATPNHGARLAALLRSGLPPALNLPPVLRGFLDGEPSRLPMLPMPTGVIAGTGGVALQRWFGAPNDGVLTIDEARLPHADFVTVPLLHVDMPKRAAVRDLAARFLATGSFAPSGGGPGGAAGVADRGAAD
ncbi:MAG: hypothetical protein U1E14_16535 [Geminicoccaceae bacterium]